MNGASSMHKPPMTGHPPRLNRSMSTPAKFGAGSYLNYGGGGGTAAANLPSLEENPFFRMQDAASQNGLMALAVSKYCCIFFFSRLLFSSYKNCLEKTISNPTSFPAHC